MHNEDAARKRPRPPAERQEVVPSLTRIAYEYDAVSASLRRELGTPKAALMSACALRFNAKRGGRNVGYGMTVEALNR